MKAHVIVCVNIGLTLLSYYMLPLSITLVLKTSCSITDTILSLYLAGFETALLASRAVVAIVTLKGPSNYVADGAVL